MQRLPGLAPRFVCGERNFRRFAYLTSTARKFTNVFIEEPIVFCRTRQLTYALIVVIALAFLPHPAAAETDTLNRLEPAEGTLFGVGLDWQNDSLALYAQRLGYKPSVAVSFFHFPFFESDLIQLEMFISEAAAVDAAALITLEPYGGLDEVTPQVAVDLATRVAAFNAAGVPVFIRFAHEMNGSWYPWSQQPALYREKHRLLAEAIYARTTETAMLWAPNYGGGYPFTGGQYEAQPGTPEFEELDTNGDGILSMDDDMYLPYYPGDDVVDWVGMSIYHWGNTYPWGENELPEANKFVEQLRGEYNGLNGDDSALPDFYAEYAIDRGKPVAIPETAALYNTEQGGGDEMFIKRTWWRQVYNALLLESLPKLKMIAWFELRKQETEIQNAVVDWRATGRTDLADAFREDLPIDRLIFSGMAPRIYTTFVPAVLKIQQ